MNLNAYSLTYFNTTRFQTQNKNEIISFLDLYGRRIIKFNRDRDKDLEGHEHDHESNYIAPYGDD